MRDSLVFERSTFSVVVHRTGFYAKLRRLRCTSRLDHATFKAWVDLNWQLLMQRGAGHHTNRVTCLTRPYKAG